MRSKIPALLAVTLLALPSGSNAAQLNYLSGGLAPTSTACAGTLDGTTLTCTSLGSTSATFDGTVALASLSTSPSVISGSGSVTVNDAGTGASASIFVPFTLFGSDPVQYAFSSSLTAGMANALLGIFDIQDLLNTGILPLDNLLPDSGYISSAQLGSGDAFFVFAYAMATKNSAGTALPSSPINASFSALFELNPISRVPEPGTLALLGLGLAGLGLSRRRKSE